jgi:hypothetical protein
MEILIAGLSALLIGSTWLLYRLCAALEPKP